MDFSSGSAKILGVCQSGQCFCRNVLYYICMDIKRCSKCGKSKPVSEFYKRPDTGNYRSACKACYPKPDPYKVSKWRRDLKKRLVEYAGGKCVDCGYQGPPFMFDFDHRDPSEKEFQISRFKCGFAKALQEVDKCDLVCAMCHRLRTHKQRCPGCEYC